MRSSFYGLFNAGKNAVKSVARAATENPSKTSVGVLMSMMNNVNAFFSDCNEDITQLNNTRENNTISSMTPYFLNKINPCSSEFQGIFIGSVFIFGLAATVCICLCIPNARREEPNNLEQPLAPARALL